MTDTIRDPEMEARILADAKVIEAAKELALASQKLLDLQDNTSPFGGEIMRDRIERTEGKFTEALAAFNEALAEGDNQ